MRGLLCTLIFSETYREWISRTIIFLGRRDDDRRARPKGRIQAGRWGTEAGRRGGGAEPGGGGQKAPGRLHGQPHWLRGRRDQPDHQVEDSDCSAYSCTSQSLGCPIRIVQFIVALPRPNCSFYNTLPLHNSSCSVYSCTYNPVCSVYSILALHNSELYNPDIVQFTFALYKSDCSVYSCTLHNPDCSVNSCTAQFGLSILYLYTAQSGLFSLLLQLNPIFLHFMKVSVLNVYCNLVRGRGDKLYSTQSSQRHHSPVLLLSSPFSLARKGSNKPKDI